MRIRSRKDGAADSVSQGRGFGSRGSRKGVGRRRAGVADGKGWAAAVTVARRRAVSGTPRGVHLPLRSGSRGLTRRSEVYRAGQTCRAASLDRLACTGAVVGRARRPGRRVGPEGGRTGAAKLLRARADAERAIRADRADGCRTGGGAGSSRRGASTSGDCRADQQVVASRAGRKSTEQERTPRALLI